MLNYTPNSIKSSIGILLFALNFTFISSNVSAYNLPDIGSSANTTLSYKSERLLGEYIYLDAQRDLPIVNNPILEDYIQKLGTKLLNNSNKHFENFHFFVINSPDINAVSLPGGFIGINTGLISFADNESELSAVLAHEITHVNQRHIARSIELQSQMQLPMLAGMVAGALLASYSPQAGQSIMMGSMAATHQSMINYTRSNEEEADRLGMAILAKSGYNPSSMGKFFSKLQRYSYNDEESYSPYLRTHPLTNNRVYEASSRADEIAINKSTKGSLLVTDNFKTADNLDFALVKSLFNPHSNNDLKYSLTQMSVGQNPQSIQQDVTEFTIANNLIKTQEFAQAQPILKKLNNKHPSNTIIASAYATSFNKQPNEALGVLEKSLKNNPNNIPLGMQYAELSINSNKLNQAVDSLKKITKSHSNYPVKVNLLLAESYNKLNQKWQANLAYADYSVQKGDYPAAIMQLKATAKFDKLSDYQVKILTYRIKELEAKFKERDAEMKTWT